ncbi:cytochrome b [Chryseobacterium fistulae]|uniref:Cytochrome b561 n=1 Tax=Chryseobacterium fistulae TaxID=2675058 RepID=A0A6N4XRG1_9FLAO|nr:cytochrome b [Chryseobacterium fistulae]CAA7390547.1 Cytochrome b561 [Chryseobacterium fistulae]
MRKKDPNFNLTARILHWLMACMIFCMLFIGAFMMTSLDNRPWLIDLHRPLGFAIFLLLIIRFINRIINPQPPLPNHTPSWQRLMANATHWFMYVLIFCLPLIGWAMLSSGNYPIILFGEIELPAITPVSPIWYAFLRTSHSILAWTLFIIVLGHLSMALLHALIYQDGVLTSIVKGKKKVKTEEPTKFEDEPS